MAKQEKKKNDIVFTKKTTLEARLNKIEKKLPEHKGKTRAESNKLTAEAIQINADIDLNKKEFEFNSKSIETNQLLNKIVLLSNYVIAPTSMSDTIVQRKVLIDEVDLGLARKKLMELIDKL